MRVLVLALMMLSDPARACSPPACRPALVAPVGPDVVPGNAPAFYLRQSFSFNQQMHGTLSELSLSDSAGQAVAVDIAPEDPAGTIDFLFRPKAPLAAGDYQIHYTEYCSGAPVSMFAAVHVGGEAALPSAIGTVQISPGIGKVRTATSSGSCTEEITAAVGEVAVTPAGDGGRWAPLSRYRLEVDGNVWSSGRYGEGIRHVYAACGNVPQGADPGLSLGAHHAKLFMHLAGAAQDPPPVELDFQLRCSANDNGGCSFGAGEPPPGSGLGLLSALALAFALVLRRRA